MLMIDEEQLDIGVADQATSLSILDAYPDHI